MKKQHDTQLALFFTFISYLAGSAQAQTIVFDNNSSMDILNNWNIPQNPSNNDVYANNYNNSNKSISGGYDPNGSNNNNNNNIQLQS